VDLVIARRAAAALALLAVVLLVLAEVTTVFEVTVGSLNVVKRGATGGENHGYALLIVAAVALAMTLLALRGGRRAPAAASLVALGATALVIALAVDLPDTRASGRLPEALAYENARAHPRAGFTLELLGGGLLCVAGGLLLVAGATGPRSSRPAAAAR
jgi:hypothetical protein